MKRLTTATTAFAMLATTACSTPAPVTPSVGTVNTPYTQAQYSGKTFDCRTSTSISRALPGTPLGNVDYAFDQLFNQPIRDNVFNNGRLNWRRSDIFESTADMIIAYGRQYNGSDAHLDRLERIRSQSRRFGQSRDQKAAMIMDFVCAGTHALASMDNRRILSDTQKQKVPEMMYALGNLFCSAFPGSAMQPNVTARRIFGGNLTCG